MKKIIYLATLMLCIFSLAACGGGGGGGTGAPDTTAPTVTALTMPATAQSLTVNVSSVTATDDVAVTGYMVTTSATAPGATDSGWSLTAPTSVTFTSAGAQTAYAWAKDAAGNVSAAKSAPVTITLPLAAPVQGAAVNPQTGSVLAGATVNAYVQANGVAKTAGSVAVRSGLTDASGNYVITGLLSGTTYYFEFVLQGYVVFTYYNVVPTVSVLVLATVNPIPTAWTNLTATVSGKVKNASTNVGLPNMTVTIRPGVGNKNGTVTAVQTTDSTGAYSFPTLAAGSYTAQVTGNIGTTPIITSYGTLRCYPGNASVDSNQDFAVTTPLSSTGSGQYRIVLSWGNNPRDLDSHLTGPTATSARFHTFWNSRDYPIDSTSGTSARVAGPTTEAFLDVDNISHGTDNGPETTTIVLPRSGVYNFYVHHYSGTATISTSSAQVNVYKNNALLATFNPPAGATGVDDVWSVFTMTVGSTGETITPVNTMGHNVSTGSLAKAVTGSDLGDYLLFRNLPLK